MISKRLKARLDEIYKSPRRKRNLKQLLRARKLLLQLPWNKTTKELLIVLEDQILNA